MTVATPTATAVLIDSREPSWIRELRFGGAPTAVQKLDAGDVQVLCSDGHLVGVERKTPSDLIHSAIDSRIFVQAANLRALTPFAYLIVDGLATCGFSEQVLHGNRDTQFPWASWVGVLATVQELGVTVIHWPNGQFENAVLQLVRRNRGESHPARRTLAIDDPALNILCALPHIGLDRGLALLRACGSPAYALWALTETHRQTWSNTAEGRTALAGIGPRTKQAVRNALGLEPGYCLVPIAEEPPDLPPGQNIERPLPASPNVLPDVPIVPTVPTAAGVTGGSATDPAQEGTADESVVATH